MEEERRIFVGGLSSGINEKDLQDRFGRFGKVTSVSVTVKRDSDGKPVNTFAHLNLTSNEVEYKKCVQLYNKAKWKGHELKIQLAKSSFIDRLKKEKELSCSEPKKDEGLTSEDHDRVRNVKVKSALPGSEVDGMENWVVGKYGRVLPVMKLKDKTKKKIVKYDPAKYCHAVKQLDSKAADAGTSEPHVDDLTWKIDEEEPSSWKGGSLPSEVIRDTSSSDGSDDDSIKDCSTQQQPVAPVDPVHSKNSTFTKRSSVGNKSAVASWLESESSSDEEYNSKYAKNGAGKILKVTSTNKLPTITNKTSSKRLVSKPRNEQVNDTGLSSSSRDDLKQSGCDSDNTDELLGASKTRKLSAGRLPEVNDTAIKQHTTTSSYPSDNSSDEDDILDLVAAGKMEKVTHKLTQSCYRAGTVEKQSILSDKTSGKEPEYLSAQENNLRIAKSSEIRRFGGKKEDDVNDDDDDDDDTSCDDDDDNSGDEDDIRGVDDEMKGTDGSDDDDEDDDDDTSCGEDDDNDGDEMKGTDGSGDDRDSVDTDELISTAKNKPKSVATVLTPQKTTYTDEYDGSIISEGRVSLKPAASSYDSDSDDILDLVTQGKLKQLHKVAEKGVKSLHTSHEIATDRSKNVSDIEIVSALLPASLNPKKDKSSPKTKRDTSDEITRNAKPVGKHDHQKDKLLNGAEKGNQDSGTSAKKLKIKRVGDSVESVEKSPASQKQDMLPGNPSSEPNVVSKEKYSTERKNHAVKQEKGTEVKSAEERHKESNKLRLASIKQKDSSIKAQKSLIQKALASVDTKSSKRKVFDSDSEDETITGSVAKMTPSQGIPDEKMDTADKDKVEPGMGLFSDSDAGDSETDDQARFRIRPEFEGSEGQKLLSRQSRFGMDERFKLDARFLEEGVESGGSNEELMATDGGHNQGSDEKSEKANALAILESVVGQKAVLAKKSKAGHFKDVGALHYDPSKEGHKHYEIPQKDPETKARKKKKKLKKEDRETVEATSVDQVLPEVSKDVFYEIDKSLADSLKKQDTDDKPFSLLSLFGGNQMQLTPDKETDSDVEMTLSSSESPWTQQMVYDSSDDEELLLRQKMTESDVASKDEASEGDIWKERHSSFFIRPDDSRLKEGVAFFCRKEDAEKIREEWLERRPHLIDAWRTRRKRIIRKIKEAPRSGQKKMYGKPGLKRNSQWKPKRK